MKKEKPFFIKIDNETLKRKDISATRKLILAYLQLRSGIKGWTFNTSDLSNTLGLSKKVIRKQLKCLEKNGQVKLIGRTKIRRHALKKYTATVPQRGNVKRATDQILEEVPDPIKEVPDPIKEVSKVPVYTSRKNSKSMIEAEITIKQLKEQAIKFGWPDSHLNNQIKEVMKNI